MARKPPTKTEPQRRIETLQKLLKREKLDAMLVYGRENTRYLTGVNPSYSFLFVTPREAMFYVDGRYIEAVREAVRHCDVRLMSTQAKAFDGWKRECKPDRIGFEGLTEWGLVESWRAQIKEAQWIESGGLIGGMRLIKSGAEIKLIERSARLNDQVYERTIAAIRPGMTEIDVRNLVRAGADQSGAEGLSFECIIASGAMGSRPHYQPQARPLRRGDLLLIDMGMKVEGYCSDMTRVVALGKKPKARLARAYDAVLKAEVAGIAALKPGVACNAVDAAARDILQKQRLGKYFTHGLGHGVGLEIHEAPRLSTLSTETLKRGMVVTVEPGVYLPGLGGIRIEDLVAITAGGHRVLSRAEKSFRIIPFDA